jgi:hypothetical protein
VLEHCEGLLLAPIGLNPLTVLADRAMENDVKGLAKKLFFYHWDYATTT